MHGPVTRSSLGAKRLLLRMLGPLLTRLLGTRSRALGRGRPAVSPRRWRSVALLAADAIAAVAALHAAFALRFEGDVPPVYARALAATLPFLVAIRLAVSAVTRLHRWSFTGAGFDDALRLAMAGVAGSAAFFVLTALVPGSFLPRTVYALEFFLFTSASTGLRFAPRLVARLRGQWLRRRAGSARAIVVGTGCEAALLARDLQQNADARYELVGFAGDDPEQVGERIEGRPVLGVVDELPALVRRHGVAAVLLASPQQPAARIRHILDLCATCQIRFKIVPASFSYLEHRLSVAMLDDVAPEDLLPRESVAFDRSEIRALVSGRRALVTGAGGSIGGEICRQLARSGARELVMVDVNENELYLGARRLAAEHPGLAVRAEVADVRELDRLLRLGARYRPQDVFHAAAHKHVPLMEDAPEEAVKNNVFGTLHVARMAVAAGAERFVFISSDKAVKPSSVMGATKRVGELVVRAIARSSRTHMTCVRFGNVLGSAGSVVPIFKEQIARGGPVTVTHPDCTRYFMTIPEAVGLVLLAGMGGYGELCVLDMGEAIRIVDLARHMITLAGRVPGSDVAITFTGLRPGEKLFEEVLTEEEELSLAVRDRIRVTHGPPPPADLTEHLQALSRLASAGDGPGLRRVLQALVPSFRPSHDGHDQRRASRQGEAPTAAREVYTGVEGELTS